MNTIRLAFLAFIATAPALAQAPNFLPGLPSIAPAVTGSATVGNVVVVGPGPAQAQDSVNIPSVNFPVGLSSTQTLIFGAGTDSSAANSTFFFNNSASGNCTGISTQCALSTFQMLDQVQDTGTQSLVDYLFSVQWGGGSTQGSRYAVQINARLNAGAVLSPSAAKNYTALETLGAANQNVGGVTGGPYIGSMFGLNPVCSLNLGATFWNSCAGEEIDVSLHTGASANQMVGLAIVQDTLFLAHPITSGFALTINNQAPVGSVVGWDYLITDGGGQGWQGLNTSGVFLSCQPHPGEMTCSSIASFADLVNYTSISSWILRGPGGNMTIDGAGNINAPSYAVGGVAGVTKTCGATIVVTHGIITSC